MVPERTDRFGHALAEISGQALEDALHSLRSKADAGEAGDGAGRKAGAVVEPEDAAVAISIGSGKA